MSQVQKFHEDKKVIVDELHKPARKNFTRRHVLQRGINDTLQIDLVEMLPYAKVNNGYKYMLTVIDIFSKKGYAKALKNKTSAEVTKAMETVLNQIGSSPKNIHSDQGKEFFNQHFKNLMSQNNINHYHTFTHMKASIVERFNRTLKTWMWKMFSLNGNYKWINMLDTLIENYNNHYHRTIKMKPNEVAQHNEQQILRSVYTSHNAAYYQGQRFKVGEKVRISKYKGIFAKGYEPSWSTEIFTVYKVQYTSPITYLLKDHTDTEVAGCFYEFELQKTRKPDTYLVEKILKKKNGKVFVKWLGFDTIHNSWVNKKQLSSS